MGTGARQWELLQPHARSGQDAADSNPAPDAGTGPPATPAEPISASAAAESLAREYQANRRSQKAAVAELRRLFPWLNTDGAGSADLAAKLGHFGYYLVLM